MSFAVLVLVCAVALVGPLLTLQRWAHIPIVIGELVVGLILGQSGFKVLHASDPTFSFMAEVGFALVMLVAGSHVPIRNPAMKAGLAKGALRAVVVGLVAVPLGLLISRVFGTGHTALYAVLIASSSASVIMPSLNGSPLTAKPIVEMLPQIAIADAACIVALPLVLDPGSAGRAALGAVIVLVLGAAAFAFLDWAERTGRRKALHELSEERGLALELRIMLVLLFGLAAVAQVMHVSIMLAGFVAGLAIAGIGKPKRLSNQTFAITEGLLGPLFFVWLGSSLNLADLMAHPSVIGLGVVLGLAAVGARVVLMVTRQPLSVAVMTSAQLGVPVAAAALGTSSGVLAPGEDTALLLGAMVTIVAVTAVSGAVTRIAQSGAVPAVAPARTKP